MQNVQHIHVQHIMMPAACTPCQLLLCRALLAHQRASWLWVCRCLGKAPVPAWPPPAARRRVAAARVRQLGQAGV